MSLMSRKVDYALLIFSHLDRHREPISAREIADHYGISKGFVGNILKTLCQQGFVESHRGVHGGYEPARPMDEISLADLMEALDDELYLAECNKTEVSEGCTLTDVCPVKGAIRGVHQRLRDVLREVTLAELFQNGNAQYGLELGSLST